MNKEVIERSAISSLNNKLGRMHVKAEIDFNDKTPVEDGAVFLYSSDKDAEYAVKDLAGRMPVQVKGTTRAPKDKMTYSATRKMLDGIRRYGGLFLFVVFVDSVDDTKNKIYFRELSKLVVDRILRNMHGKNSKSIWVHEFPKDNHEALLQLCRSADQIERQGTTLNVEADDRPKQLQLRTYGDEKLEDVLKRSDVTMYKVVDGTPIPYSTIDPDTVEVYGLQSARIRFKEESEEFISEVKGRKGYLEINTGVENKIQIIIKDNKVTVTFHDSDDFTTQVRNTNTLITFLDTKGTFFLNDHEEYFGWNKDDPDVTKLRKTMIELRDRLQIVRILERETHLPFFMKNPPEDVNKLLHAVIYKYKHPNKKEHGVYRVVADGKVFYLMIIPVKDQNRKVIIRSIFQKATIDSLSMVYNHSGVKFKMNPYTYGDDPIEEIGDYDPKLVQTWFEETGVNSDVEERYANDYSFQLLRAYEKTQNNSFRDLAIYITKMTFEYDSDENVSFLNYMQALKRRDRVSLSKMKRLFEISKDGESRERFAAKLLLEASDEDVLEAWGEVDDIEKKQLQKFPIFDFVKGSLRQKIS
ncbi:hypothetical protein [Levilactobacillus tongjiangensis]|uniref:DUF4365 domain-containing protein n=1 Tax=Levilactobacillus tongjiangensis TaxID=2486023 RepID=A0ABW1SQH3_9LACO|nr:hypothetical protein [Levilactobacillus tongjiangensis]